MRRLGSRLSGRRAAPARRPAYLSITARRRPPAAAPPSLWGRDVPTALARLQELHGRAEAAVIGPAGECGVLFASIVNNRGRQIGRGGLGAVMGAKQPQGDRPLPVEGGLLPATGRSGSASRRSSPRGQEGLRKADPITSRSLPDFGTSVLVNVLDQAGALPTRNFRDSRFEAAEQISGEAAGLTAMRPARRLRRLLHRLRPHASAAGGESGERPEYESLWALGADCGIGDLAAIVAGQLRLQPGRPRHHHHGLNHRLRHGAHRGGPAGRRPALRRRAPPCSSSSRRPPRAAALATSSPRASRRLAARYGRPELAMQVKGLELPAYDPRGMTGQGLAFATSNRGACHLRANMLGPEILGMPKLIDRFATLARPALLIHMQDLNAVLDSLVGCKFAAFAMKEDYFARLLSAVCRARRSSRRSCCASASASGRSRSSSTCAPASAGADDTLPPRLLDEPVAAGPAAGHVVDLPPMLDEYYAARGWDAEGGPRRASWRSSTSGARPRTSSAFPDPCVRSLQSRRFSPI